MGKSAIFREAISRPGVLRLVGAHNGLCARLIERHGFEGVWASGLEISTSHALPDANILTMTEYLSAAQEMNDACALPVVADCDTGYGNSNNAMHMVRRYEAAGIAAVCIEDKKFPKVNSYVPGRQELAPVGEFVGKIMAAKAVQATPDFMVIARVEALIAGWGMEEALRRANAYADAGADMILMHSKLSTDAEIREFLSRWGKRLPVVIVPTTYPDINVSELEEMGVKVVIFANHGLRAAVKAMDRILARMQKENGIAGLGADDIVSMATIFDLQGMTRMKEEELAYTTTDRAVILAAGEPNNDSLTSVLGDRPVAMLDINGKSLLQRTIDQLNICGVQDVVVVGGYKADAISANPCEVVVNSDYSRTGGAASLMLVDPRKAERILLVYGDVMFDRHILSRLLDTAEDLVIAIDDSFRHGAGDRNIDLVETEEAAVADIRMLDSGSLYRVTAIGRDVSASDRAFEFVGLASISKSVWPKVRRAFTDAVNANTMAVPDLIAAVLASGQPVHGLRINSGWKEIHTFDHYREACAMVRS